jgi:hypothetical protein
LSFDDCFFDLQCENDVLCLFPLLYCWFKINETNDKDWILIPECIKDVNDDEYREIFMEKSLKLLVNLSY